MLRQSWWKILSIVLLPSPSLLDFWQCFATILNETIRNLYFHVSMWFCMMILFTISLVYSIKFLRGNKMIHDRYEVAFAQSGIVFGILGLITGMIWANYTWGKPWSNDPKQLGAAIALLIYFAYLVLRNSLIDESKRAKTSAVYNVFAYAMLFPTIWILPRMMESLHPGGMGNPALDTHDIDGRRRYFLACSHSRLDLIGV
jgi:heme exporter protein C